MTWVTIRSDNDKWASQITGFRWGDGETDPDQKTYTAGQAFLDAGLPCIYGPTAYVTPILNNIISKPSSYKTITGGYTFDCSETSKVPNFYLNFGGYWIEMRASDFIIDIG